ncbi:RagB/SusD family nutrient uptake outer membrane protein [Dyadobacter sp. CY312]|uniref:RagB/SusD family nutrient uptake outer membrane protein n=1 Tax=Dyadobacter sp. CY312 TaxID=2907303 RepID=UPI001F26CEE8|nr:RagB/SusD family nutrient uptake outer membrane protein [Dyadobacter sp. CY312]MCE7044253.1 RagB/SusD family nutrient uptake outer membrane protein [Dyadobacter sp. CY312]
MKLNSKYIIAAILSSGVFYGCDKLEQVPVDKLSLSTTLINEFGFQTYAWQFYGAFTAYDNSGVAQGGDAGTVPNRIDTDVNSDVLAVAAFNSQSKWLAQLMIPSVTDGFYTSTYSRLRTINVMLANIDNSPLSDEGKNHWRAVCYFFRAYNYANLINLYGDVPYVDKLLTDTDTEGLYIPRTPRDEVAKHILDDLNYAIANLRTKSNPAYLQQSNAVDPDAALALISRFGLREGTWRKYHGLADANTYLQASADASKKLMDKFPTLAASYDEDFNSDDLSNVPGIVMFKAYGGNGTTDVGQGLTGAQMSRFGFLDLTKAAVDQYLCTDGQTRYTSPLFQGDKNAFDEFRNRDRRLYYTVPPPYKVVIGEGNTARTFTYTTNPRDTSYFGLMERISNPLGKLLPTKTIGLPGQQLVIGIEPNFYDVSLYGQGTNYQNTFTGYRLYKYANNISSSRGKYSDAPIFRMGEVLVNYAEAMYELGQFNQAIADATINKTRARGKIALLNIANIPNDPTRDAGVTPILWEIRRERTIELMAEGFRFNDLRRWKKMEYATKIKLGRYIKKGVDDIPANTRIPIQGGGNEGYISYEPLPKPNWPAHYYLYPIPIQEISINDKLVQNPGW